jgi:hypothetical protein
MSDSNLESEFKEELRQAVQEATKKIDEALERANAALSEAEQISEQYGIPFRSSISPIRQSYLPMSYHDKWGRRVSNIDVDISDVLWDEGIHIPHYEGWQHSAVC